MKRVRCSFLFFLHSTAAETSENDLITIFQSVTLAGAAEAIARNELMVNWQKKEI